MSAAWYLAGLWVALAMYFTAPLPHPLRFMLGLATMSLFIAAWRRTPRWRLAAFGVGMVYAGWHFVLVQPRSDIAFDPDQAVMPAVAIDGNRVSVGNARRFAWRSPTDFTPSYYDAVFDASQVTSMHYAVVPFGLTGSLAHVFLSFGFADGQHVAVSIEARRPLGRAYSPVASAFRQYQLIYVIGDERDILGLRAVTPGTRIQFYPARATVEARRLIFLDVMARAAALQRTPEFYNLATSNCMSNLMLSLRKLPNAQWPGAIRLIFTGFSDEAAYELGYIDTALRFDQARDAFRVDARVRKYLAEPDFSHQVRRVQTFPDF